MTTHLALLAHASADISHHLHAHMCADAIGYAGNCDLIGCGVMLECHAQASILASMVEIDRGVLD